MENTRTAVMLPAAQQRAVQKTVAEATMETAAQEEMLCKAAPGEEKGGTQASTGGQQMLQVSPENPLITVYEDGITEEIVHGYLPTKLNFLFARNWGSYPLKDGRYVYEEWFKVGKKLYVKKKAYGNVPGDVLEFLTETDRKDTNGQRKSKDHADMSGGYEDGEEDEQTGEFHRSAMDRAAYQQWVRKESRDDEVDDPIYPDELLKQQFVPGDNKANNQRWQMRRQVVQQFIPRLTRKQRDTVNRYYGMAMTEAQIGKEDGTGKQAVSNILNEDVKPNLREVFTRLGFDVPTEEELKEEAVTKKDREDARKEAEKDRRTEEREIRMIHAVVSGEASEEDYIETGTVKYEPSEDDMEAETRDTTLMDDFDPDNPYDSVSDDYDPYDDPRYQGDEDEDYWEEEDVAEPDDE